MKFIVGYKAFGYDTIEVTDNRLENPVNGDSEVVIVLDENSTNPLKDYYKAVLGMLKSNNKVILIGVGESNKLFKPLAALMASYRAYDIYNVVKRDVITTPYLEKLEKREPDFNEVQTYIGGDIAAYTEMSTLMIGIDAMVQQGELDKLANFLEQHMSSIESLSSALDYMKSVCESYNVADLSDKIESLEKMVTKHKEESTKLSDKVQSLKLENDQINQTTEDLKKEIEKLKHSNEALKEAKEANSSSNVISMFNTLRTSECICKVNSIIYFKEISYVPYMNSFVLNLREWIEKKWKKKIKLIIYDNKTEFTEVYNPLALVNGKVFISNKDLFLHKNNIYVVTEPVQGIIRELITQEDAPDALIIYDRMRTNNDIVDGNNVTKYFVLNSNREYQKLVSRLHISNEKRIITRSDSDFSKFVLDIPFIKDYKGASDSKKLALYSRLGSSISKVQLINTIARDAHIITDEEGR
jgi:archaellum component FlaC